MEKLTRNLPGALGSRIDEEPSYEVLVTEGQYEIRRYERLLLAQVSMEGEHDEVMERGFTKLANYIFGDNEEGIQMSMTTPVFQELRTGNWILSFYIPPAFNLKTVPEPYDEDISFIEYPVKVVAVKRYSGNNDELAMLEQKRQLLQWVSAQNLTTISDVFWAQYDPPFALPFVKRNECLVTVKYEQ